MNNQVEDIKLCTLSQLLSTLIRITFYETALLGCTMDGWVDGWTVMDKICM